MSGYTKGPWVATQYGYEKFSVNGEKGVEICGAWNKANASLIAAAPELLEALELIVLTAQENKPARYYLEGARAAIAKAKGEKA